jgi:hypothetical protein
VYAIFGSGVSSQRDGWKISSPVRAALAYLLDQCVAILLRHREIRNQRMWEGVLESFQRIAG